MDDKTRLAHELDDIQNELKELEIRYEQYFTGIERREPQRDRDVIARRLRQFTNRHITCTDLKFRYQSMATRFMTYCRYWDRILREMDEGRYHRHIAKLKPQAEDTPLAPPKPPEAAAAPTPSEAELIRKELGNARKSLGLNGMPSLEKVSSYLNQQREKIRERYGDKPIRFSVGIKDGKPFIKASMKR
ncbi:MAG: hypothetical protein C0622_06860 [Desulfuromonas sp.]|nr:MAG: hypothetical protein C0622_06860 [Desulfuromonas sp.]